MRFVLALATLTTLHAHAAAAQAPVYARTPGDTLRYAERVETRTRIVGDEGVDRYTHQSRVAITFGAGDTARAWFEWLRLEDVSRYGRATGGADAEGMPYLLAFGPRGVDSTLAAPNFPESVDSVARLETQFANFLPRLPDFPLSPGTAWADTMVVDESSALTEGGHVRTLAYRVVADSVMDGVPVTVVEFTARVEGELRGTRSDFHETWRRDEQGRFYFAPARGVLVRRTRSGTETVRTTSSRLAGPRDTRREYTSTIDLLSGP